MGIYILGIWIGSLAVCIGIGNILAHVLGVEFWIYLSMFSIWVGSGLLFQSLAFFLSPREQKP